MSRFVESVVEGAALAWLESLGGTVKQGPEIAPGELAGKRADHGAVVLERQLRDALTQLKSELPPEAMEDPSRKLTLADLRNALLPKSLSGEMRVKDAEKSVEGHT